MPRITLVLLQLGLSAGALLAQEAAPPGAAPARDSARALRSARSEQSRFEMIRRRHLPWAWGGGSGECHERIGRFCLSFEDSDEEWVPKPDPEEIVQARERLIERLSSAARAIPGDAWVAGQRVRYLVEAKRFDDARAAAAECRAEGWWCAALLGYATHHAGHAAGADSAFSRMLDQMPASERARWTDLSLILDDRALGAYRRLPQPGRTRFESRFWRLADPFLTRPGNDLRSEHLARNLLDQLQDRAKSTEGISWGDDLREILVRYGWPVGWERVRPRPGSLEPPSLVSHYSNTDQSLLPPVELLLDSASVVGGGWDVELARPRAGYSLLASGASLKWIHPLDHQVAVFRRGDSLQVVAAYALPADSLPEGAGVHAGLALSPAGGEEPIVVTREARGAEGTLTGTAPSGALLLSLELLSEQAKLASRARFGIDAPRAGPGMLAISDLLLLRPADTLPESLEAAVEQARGSTRVRSGEQVGVFWEVYGLSDRGANLLTMSLRLVDRRKGWMRRVAERIGLVRAMEPIRMSWQEPAAAQGRSARSLIVQVPPELPAGDYSLELTVELIGEEPTTVERRIEVTGGG